MADLFNLSIGQPCPKRYSRRGVKSNVIDQIKKLIDNPDGAIILPPPAPPKVITTYPPPPRLEPGTFSVILPTSSSAPPPASPGLPRVEYVPSDPISTRLRIRR